MEHLTTAGRALLTRMLAGDAHVTFTKMQMGDGELPSGSSEEAMSALVNPVETISVSDVTIDNDYIVTVSAIFRNGDTGFYFREKGVFATDGTDEVLVLYANYGDDASYVSPASDRSIERRLSTVITGLDSTQGTISIELASSTYARDTFYDNSLSGLSATTAQAAIDEVLGMLMAGRAYTALLDGDGNVITDSEGDTVLATREI